MTKTLTSCLRSHWHAFGNWWCLLMPTQTTNPGDQKAEGWLRGGAVRRVTGGLGSKDSAFRIFNCTAVTWRCDLGKNTLNRHDVCAPFCIHRTHLGSLRDSTCPSGQNPTSHGCPVSKWVADVLFSSSLYGRDKDLWELFFGRALGEPSVILRFQNVIVLTKP